MQAFKDKLAVMSRRQKFLVAAVIVVCGLFFYAFGIVTGLFGSSVFSVFWVVNVQAAYDISYGVLAGAVTLSVVILIYKFLNKFRLKLEAMTQRQKLLVALIVAVYGLIFYAFGIATNLFASPAFSLFWIISAQTAHYIAYGVAAAAITLSIIILALNSLKRRKKCFP